MASLREWLGRARKRSWWLFLLIAAAGAAADIESKNLAHAKVRSGGEHFVVRGYFSIRHDYNEGIVFSQFQKAGKLWLIVTAVSVPIVAGLFAFSTTRRTLWTVALGLILGGTLGNLYDRVFFGKIRDFLRFIYDAHHSWPVFNLADSWIVAGALLLAVEMIFFDRKRVAPPPAPSGNP